MSICYNAALIIVQELFSKVLQSFVVPAKIMHIDCVLVYTKCFFSVTGKSHQHEYEIEIDVPASVADRIAVRDPSTLAQLYATHGRFKDATFTLIKVK